MKELPGTKKVQRFLKGLVQGAMAMAAATCLLAPATAQAASSGSQLDPQDFVSLGTLSPASGTTLVFSTGATPPTISDGVNTYKGVNTVLTSGITTTVFCFDDINLQAGSVLDLSLTNNKPCALLSRTNIRVSTNINADASTRTSHAFGGYDGGNNGRNAGSTSPAFSTGGGKAGSTGNTCGGGGGANGGNGGRGGYSGGTAPAGGTKYGDDPVTVFCGGAGGAGGAQNATNGGVGGAGGGALQLSARGTITIDAGCTISLRGQTPAANNASGGGGGAGGTLLIIADTVQNNGALNVNGGTGGKGNNTSAGGGGGGGGRIACYYATTCNLGSNSANSGAAGANGVAPTNLPAAGNSGSTYVLQQALPTAVAEVATLDGTTELVSGTTTAVKFGATAPAAPLTKTFTVYNSGFADLTTSNLSVTGNFSITEPLNATIAPGTSDTFTVQFVSSTSGVNTGSVSFESNDSNESPYIFPISAIVYPALPYNEDFESLSVSDGTSFGSDSAGVIAGLTDWQMRNGNAVWQVPAAGASPATDGLAYWYDFLSGAGLPAATGGAVPAAAKALKGSYVYTVSATELAPNGNFDTDASSWTTPTGWGWSGGAVVKSADGTGALETAATIPAIVTGHQYALTYTLSGMTSTGNIGPVVGGVPLTTRSNVSTATTYTQNFLATSDATTIKFTPSVTGVRCTIDSVSLRELNGSIVQAPCTPIYVPTRNFTAKAKFAITSAMTKNDMRFGVNMLGYNADQGSSSILLKLGNNNVVSTKDLQLYSHANVNAVATTTSDWGTSADDTDYEVGKWNTVEFDVTTDATNTGKTRVWVNGKRIFADVSMKPLSDTALNNGVRFAFINYYDTIGTVLFDDLSITSGLTDHALLEVADGATVLDSGKTLTFSTGYTAGPATTKTITIRNNGTAALTTAGLSVTGDFSLKAGESLDASIAPGGSDTVIVEMAVGTSGAKVGTLTFTSNDYDYKLNLAGTSVQTATLPTISDLAATPAINRVDLSWTAIDTATNPTWASYDVLRGDAAGGPYTAIATSVVNASYSDTDAALVAGTTYYYVVRSRGMDYFVSPYSNEAATAPLALVVDTEAPAIPTGLTAHAGAASQQISLTWDRNAELDFNGYQVYMSTSPSELVADGVANPLDKIADVAQTGLGVSPTYDATGLTNGVTYYFAVTAKDLSSNESHYSSVVAKVPRVLIAAPTGLTVGNSNSHTLFLDWADNAEAELAGYDVYRSTVSGTSFTKIGTSALSRYTDSGPLTNGSTYYYVVKAVDNEANRSADSTQGSGAPTALIPTINSVRVGYASGNATITWTDTDPDVTGYFIYHSTQLNSGYSKINTAPTARTGNTQSIEDTGRTNGVVHYYKVASLDSTTPTAITSAFSNEMHGVINPIPANPGGLTATAGNAKVTLNWTLSGVARVVGYNLYRSTTAGGPYSSIGSTLKAVTTFDDTTAVNGTKYYYIMKAYDDQTPANESGASSEVNATPSVPLAMPTGLVAQAGAVSGRVSLSWNANTDPTLAGYTVLRSTASSGTYTSINTVLAPAVACVDNGLVDGTTYWYEVQAFGTDTGISPVSSAVMAIPGPPPAAPTGLALSNSGAETTVDWADNAEADVLTGGGYNVYRSAVNNTAYVKLNSTLLTASTYSDAAVTPGTKYYYKVVAVDVDGNASADSAEANITVLTAPTGVVTSAGVASSRVTVSWAANPEATVNGYNVLVANAAAGPYTKHNASTITGLNYNVDGLTNGTTYWFAVRAQGSDGATSARSNGVSGVPVYVAPLIAAPTGLSYTNGKASGQLTLKWNAVSGAVKYNVYRASVSGGPYTKITPTGVTGLSFTDTALPNGVNFYYVVTASNGTDESVYSSQLTAQARKPLSAVRGWLQFK